MANTWSMACALSSFRVNKCACLGCKATPQSFCANDCRFLPLMRTTPTAPRPVAVAMAMMGSSRCASMCVTRVFCGWAYLCKPSCLLIIHCWAIDKILLDNQYNTKPAGKKKNMTLKASGMNHIILA